MKNKSRRSSRFLTKFRKKISWKVTLIFCSALLVLFMIYLRSLYRQMNASFHNEEEFVPTRIYSDLFRVTPPLEREQLAVRLRNLNYKVNVLEGKDFEITLRPIDYPNELLPKEHPTEKSAGKKIRFNFPSPSVNAPLESIQAEVDESTEILPEIYLEPQLIATFGKSDQNAKREIRKVLTFNDIPASVWQAIIAVEDPRFLEHKGIDPRGIARAIWVNLRTGSLSQGGSTITAQLVKNLMERHTRNLFRKFNELFLALLLELRYSKEEILTRYLNEVYLGSVGGYEVHGVSEGAELFFGKDLQELNLGEITLMAGLIL
jgi:penicillin-binding protein 1B